MMKSRCVGVPIRVVIRQPELNAGICEANNSDQIISHRQVFDKPVLRPTGGYLTGQRSTSLLGEAEVSPHDRRLLVVFMAT